MDGRLTFVEAVHVQLPDKRRDVGMFEVLPGKALSLTGSPLDRIEHDLRKHFGEIGRRRHHKTLVIT